MTEITAQIAVPCNRWKKKELVVTLVTNPESEITAHFSVLNEATSQPVECSRSVWAEHPHTGVVEPENVARHVEFGAAAALENSCCTKYFGSVSSFRLLMVPLHFLVAFSSPKAC